VARSTRTTNLSAQIGQKLNYNNISSRVSNSNISDMKVTVQSPIPPNSNQAANKTPIMKSRQHSSRFKSTSDIAKIYGTPMKVNESSVVKIIDKLPSIDMKKLNVNKMTISPSINFFKKTVSKGSTMSLDTGSTSNSLAHKRTLSNFNKKNIK
jgi:hypothetical protein